MKITKQELTTILAEKVMGWKIDKNHGYYRDLPSASSVYACSVEDWNPLEDANHALQVLEGYGYNLSNMIDGECVCSIYNGNNEIISRGFDECQKVAICLAVAEATTGNKYELEV